jgi:NADH-quinone oxidoreductase subunit H
VSPMVAGLVAFVDALLKAALVIGIAMNIVPLLIYLERKICAYIQGRIGPNRVNLTIGDARYIPGLAGMVPDSIAGFRLIPGSLQPLADAIKLAFKEEIIPQAADKTLYYIAPVLAFVPVATALAFIPFGTATWDFFGTGYNVNLQIAPANVGVLGLFAISALGVYGIACGGWGSGSKYPLMGAVRSSAQMISYEVAMGLAIVAAIATVGSVDLQRFVLEQAESWGGFGWLVFKQPIAALVFMVAMFAENNRLPFDLPEAEPELVAGYHTEYSGLKFALFFLGEYMAMILMCSLFVTMFLGGWSMPVIKIPGLEWTLMIVDPHATDGINALKSGLVFLTKLMILLNFMIWIRWTLPRFRYDQLMHLGWKVLVPLALANLVLTAVVLTFTS